MSATNPFFESSLLPYQAPRFDEINDGHYRPAFDEAIRQKRAEIDAIVAQTAAPISTIPCWRSKKRCHALACQQRFLRHDLCAHQ